MKKYIIIFFVRSRIIERGRALCYDVSESDAIDMDETMKNHPLRIICLITISLVIAMMGTAIAFAADDPGTQTLNAQASGAQTPGAQTPSAPAGSEEPPDSDVDEETPDADADEEAPVLAETRITGVPAKLSENASAKLSFTVKVSPADGTRTVKLQQYLSSDKSWHTRATYHTKDEEKAKVKVTIAKKYREKTTGKWRVFVKASNQAQEAVSRVFTVTSRNVTTKKLSARSACIYCIDNGELIYTKEHLTRRSPASTTKLMTAVILVESGKLNGKTRISKKAANTPWGSGRLKKGDTYRNIDLLYAMLLPSSNDASVAVAEGVSGSTGKFVKRMNRKAKKMGLDNTHFCNPHGLHDSDHYTTAFELAKLTAYAQEKEEIRKALQTKSRTITSTRYHRTWTLYSSDSLLGTIKNFLGGKTGTGEDAKFCFAGIYKHKKKTYVTIVLGAPTAAKRWNDTRKLHSYIRKYAATKY